MATQSFIPNFTNNFGNPSSIYGQGNEPIYTQPPNNDKGSSGQPGGQQMNPFQQWLMSQNQNQNNSAEQIAEVFRQQRRTGADDRAAAAQAKTDSFFGFKSNDPAIRASQGNTAENQWARLGHDPLTQSQQEAGATGMNADQINTMKQLQGQAAVMQRDQQVPLQTHGVVEQGPNGQNKIYNNDGFQVGSSYQADPNMIGPPAPGKINGMFAQDVLNPKPTYEQEQASWLAGQSPADQAEYARLVAQGQQNSPILTPSGQKKPGRGGFLGTGLFAPR